MTAVPSLERQQVLAELRSSARGLSADEAAARRAEVGANRLPAARRRPVLAEFGSQFANMFAVVVRVNSGKTGAAATPTIIMPMMARKPGPGTTIPVAPRVTPTTAALRARAGLTCSATGPRTARPANIVAPYADTAAPAAG
ncbi:MAG: cation-transporting P-type ATPase [Streptosporangiaceae bacterium]